MSWLVTGGAGYIGAHVVRAFDQAGIPTVIVDNLSSGVRSFVPTQTPFVEADIRDTATLTTAMKKYDVEGIVHIAGYKYAGESVKYPRHTYDQNVTGTVSVLNAMAEAGVSAMVFSSSAAVYGTPQDALVTEQTALDPQSPYGETKLIGEWLLANERRASGLKAVALRYFNVVGSGDPSLWDSSPHNLFPLVVNALRAGQTPKIFGDDYNTEDGTCVRDYVHVADIAHSHVAAAQKLSDAVELLPVYNLGSGAGLSVRNIMTTMAKVSGVDFQPDLYPRRLGDPDRIVADGSAAARDLDWKMRYSVEEMARSAWQAGLQNGS